MSKKDALAAANIAYLDVAVMALQQVQPGPGDLGEREMKLLIKRVSDTRLRAEKSVKWFGGNTLLRPPS